jgi:hypothetical protein
MKAVFDETPALAVVEVTPGKWAASLNIQSLWQCFPAKKRLERTLADSVSAETFQCWQHEARCVYRAVYIDGIAYRMPAGANPDDEDNNISKY